MPASRRVLVPIAAAASVAAVAAVAAPSAPAAPAGDRPEPVKIVNTIAEAIPVLVQNVLQVTGTVSIDGPVRIDDSTPLQVAAAEPAGAPAQVFKPLMSGSETSFSEVMLEVPAGKRFIAEQVSGEAHTDPDGDIKVQFAAQSTISGQPVSQTFTVPLEHQFTNVTKRFAFNEEMHFTVDGPGAVTVSMIRLGQKLDTDVANGTSIVGRLVDCASCQPPRE